jgi:hypothetical protein
MVFISKINTTNVLNYIYHIYIYIYMYIIHVFIIGVWLFNIFFFYCIFSFQMSTLYDFFLELFDI